MQLDLTKNGWGDPGSQTRHKGLYSGKACDYSLICLLFQEALCIQCGYTACAGAGDRLAVDVVLHVACLLYTSRCV